jgi:phenylalanyl-tRNA synthetase beta chain
MKFSEQWLREWVNPEIPTTGLVDQLTGAGLEVDTVESVSEGLHGVVVAEIVEVAPHPDAERLRLCSVRAAPGEAPVQVVCGAPNVFAGMRAPLAGIGARLPGGVKIGKSKIRGVESQGMLCSARELGLGDDADGILTLGPQARVGEALEVHLGLDDTVIEVDLTPNRGDCLSIAGIAREVGVANQLHVRWPPVDIVPARIDATFPVALESQADCPRYVGRIIRGIDPAAATPVWMRERLRRCGVRSISPVVDVSNYVMLELGQPMHAFDLGRLKGGIRVRRARPGERLVLLDERELEVDGDSLVIADHERCVALAGIMGGLDSAVTDETRDLFLESAWFAPRTIGVEARRHGLHTDASHRFERGVATDGQARAVERATTLLLEIVGGEPGPTVDTLDASAMPPRAEITLRASRIRRLLGCDPPAGTVTDVLTRLGVEIAQHDDEQWRVTAPAFRPDLAIEADLVEEVARVMGYDSIPEHAPEAELMMTPRPEEHVETRALRTVLVQRGYQEAITFSFVDPRMQALVEPREEAIALANPISSDLAVMRTSLWPGLLGAMLHNTNRQQPRVRLFESGLVFRRHAGGVEQTPVIGGVATGPAQPEQWGLEGRPADFYDVKSDVEALVGLAGDERHFDFEAAVHPALHSGQCARVVHGGETVGWLGAVHPRLTSDWRLSTPVYVFELRLGAIQEGPLPSFQALSRFPAVRRDLAVVVDEDVSAAAVRDCVGQVGIDVLDNLEFFDVYRGKGIDSGKKSLALSLTFQATSRTLHDQEVDDSVRAIVASLAHHLGAELRG